MVNLYLHFVEGFFVAQKGTNLEMRDIVTFVC
jgi:hypothetical protein